ncbi:MAG: hypothetical protein QOG01_435 [Pseudonocardiales bacterium]|jgi:uncharacterized protein YjbJ (UPF0337 family)|nr:hypothetical protein [Pseudonocardiales bacterium]
MEDRDDEPTESPATWENVVVGKAKEAVGHAIGDEEMTEEGEDQEDIAHEVREEFREEHQA